jgi:hypothetical protein
VFIVASTIQNGGDEGHDPILWVCDWRLTKRATTSARTIRLCVREMAVHDTLRASPWSALPDVAEQRGSS